MSKDVLIEKDFLYNKLEEMINIAKGNNTSKIAIGKMQCVRNNIHHSLQDMLPMEVLTYDEDNHWFQCPNCGCVISYDNNMEDHKFCLNCGKELLW